jgi:hypothetical protein
MYIIVLLFILFVVFSILLLGTGMCIDNKCLPYNGMNKKEEKEYLKQFIKNNPEYAEEDCLLL